MTILFLTRLFYPHIGGVEKHIWEISHILTKMGHKIVIITEDINNTPHEIKDGIEIYRFNSGEDNWYKKFRIWEWMVQNKAIFNSANIVHCHDVFFWYLPIKILSPNKKVFTTFHGHETIFPIKKSAIIIRKISENLSCGNICVGAYIAKWYGTKPTYVTYGGTEVPKNFKEKAKKLKLGFVGRLSKDNGISIYAKALKDLTTTNTEFSFSAFGSGNEEKKFSQFGKINEMINPDISSIQILFASSYLSILEGLANKKIIIAVYINELKKDYLLLSPFSNYITIAKHPDTIIKTINNYIQSPHSFDNTIDSGFKFAREQTWEKVTRTYLTLWKL